MNTPAASLQRSPETAFAEAERYFLGWFLRGRTVDEVCACSWVRPEWFADRRLRVVWKTILDMVEDNEPVDLVLVTRWLRKNNTLQQAGGGASLSGLVDLPVVPEHLDRYAKEIQKAAQCREVAALADDVKDMAVRGNLGGVQTLLRQFEDLQPSTTKRLVPLTAAPPSTRYLVKNVVPVEGRLLVAAQPKVGKSLLVQSLAVAVAAGKPFLGLCERFPVADNRGPVILVDEELPRATLWYWVAAIARAMGADLNQLQQAGRLVLFSRCGVQPGDPATWGELVQEVRHREPSLVVLDPVIPMLSGSASEQEVAGAFWRAASQLNRLGTAVAAAHHMAKNAELGALGSIYWRGGCDVELSLTGKPQDPSFRVSWTAMRDAYPPPFYLRKQFDGKRNAQGEVDITDPSCKVRLVYEAGPGVDGNAGRDQRAQARRFTVLDWVCQAETRERKPGELQARFGGERGTAERKRLDRDLSRLLKDAYLIVTPEGNYRPLA